jgi:uncharacterized phage protein (TIGR02218 family)
MERSDGAGIALTSHDQPLTIDAVRYQPAPGMKPAAVTRTLGLEPHAGEVAGALSSDALVQADLAAGRWDAAQIRLSAIDWNEPSETAIDLLAGEIGSVSIDDEAFTADLSGAAARLDEPVCPATSPECRARFGDKLCRVDLAGRSIRAKLVSAGDGDIELDLPVDERFILGRLLFLSGPNCGLASVILAANGTTIQVRDRPRAPITADTVVELREGCDKRFGTCVSRFANAENFRGEPHLPGSDLLTRYPGA